MSDEYQKKVYSQTLKYEDFIRYKIVKKTIIDLLSSSNQNLLDVGCGNGHLTAPFVKLHNCYGIDLEESSLSIAKNRGLTTFRVNLENGKVPVQPNFFDLIVCSEVIEHVCNTENLLNELNRVLKKKGFLILTFPNINQPVSWFAQIVFDLPPVYSSRYKSPHVRDFTLRLVKKILPVFGFHINYVKGTYIYPFKGKFSQWLAKRIPRLSEKIVIVSTKQKKPTKTDIVIWDSRLLLVKKNI